MLFDCCKRPSTLNEEVENYESQQEDQRRSVQHQPPSRVDSHFDLLGLIIFGVGNQKMDAAAKIAEMTDPLITDPLWATRHRQEFLALEGQGPGAIIKHLCEMLRDHSSPSTFITAAARALSTLSLEATFGTFESSQAHTIKRAMEAASSQLGSGPAGLPVTPPPPTGSSSWVVLKDSLDILVPALASVIKSSPRSEAAVFASQALSNLALGPALVPSLLKRLFPPQNGSNASSIAKQLVDASHTPFSLASSVAAAQGGTEANIVKVKRWIAQLLLNSSIHRGLSASLDAARSIHSLLILLEDRTVTSPKIHEICLCAIYNSIQSEESSVQRSIELLSSPHASKALCSQLLDPLSGDCRYYACLVITCILRSAGFNTVWGVLSSRWSDGGADDEGEDPDLGNLKRTLQVPRDPHYLKITQLLISMKMPGCIQQAISSCLVDGGAGMGSSSSTASFHRVKNQPSGLTLISKKGLLQTLITTLHALCAMVGDRGIDGPASNPEVNPSASTTEEWPHPLHLVEAGFPARLLQLITMKSSPDPHLSSAVLALLSYLSAFKVTRDQLLTLPFVYSTLCDVLSSPLTLAAQQCQQNAAAAAKSIQSRRATNESQASAPSSRRNSSSNIAVTLDMQEGNLPSGQEGEEAKEELQRSEAAWGTCRGLAAKILRNMILADSDSLLASPSSPRTTLATLVPTLLLSLLTPHRVHLYEKEQKKAEADVRASESHDQSFSAHQTDKATEGKDKGKEVDFTTGPATGHCTPKLIAVLTPREILEGAAKKLSGGGGGGGVGGSSSPSLPNGKGGTRRGQRGRKVDDPFCPSSLFLPIQEASLSMITAPDWAREVQRHALAILMSISGDPKHAESIRSTICDSAGIHVISEVMKAASYPTWDLPLPAELTTAGEEHKKQVAAWGASLLLLLFLNAEGSSLEQFADAFGPSPIKGAMGKKELSPMKASVAFLQVSRQHQQMNRMHRPLQPLNHAAAEVLSSVNSGGVNQSLYGPMVSARLQMLRSPDKTIKSTASSTGARDHEKVVEFPRVSVIMSTPEEGREEEEDVGAKDGTPTKASIKRMIPEAALQELGKVRQPCTTSFLNQNLTRAQEMGGLRLDCGVVVEVEDKLASQINSF